MRRRLLVVLAAVLPVAALIAAVVAFGGGGGHGSAKSPGKLPIAYGSGSSGGRAAATAFDAAEPSMYPFTPTHYVAAHDLPDLGGSGPAYKIVGDVTDDAVLKLAHALGISGSITEQYPGYLTVGDLSGAPARQLGVQ